MSCIIQKPLYSKHAGRGYAQDELNIQANARSYQGSFKNCKCRHAFMMSVYLLSTGSWLLQLKKSYATVLETEES